MRKLLLIIAVIIVLSGCGNKKTLTCTSSNKVGEISSNTVYKIEYKNKTIDKIIATYTYKDEHTPGVGTGTDGTTEGNNNSDNNVVDGVVGDALDDVVDAVGNTILDIAGIKSRHSNKFGTYVNTKGFTMTTDEDNDNDYKVTYTYDLNNLTDEDLNRFGITKDLDTQKKNYQDRNMTCK